MYMGTWPPSNLGISNSNGENGTKYESEREVVLMVKRDTFLLSIMYEH
mgnify:CR=1 FL=1